VYTGTVDAAGSSECRSFLDQLFDEATCGPHRPVLTADRTRLCLTFHADTVAGPLAAADAALRIGLSAAVDDLGQGWPRSARQMSIGDLLTVGGPDGATTRLRVDAVGFTQVGQPDQPIGNR
jgi:hypothetical protein